MIKSAIKSTGVGDEHHDANKLSTFVTSRLADNTRLCDLTQSKLFSCPEFHALYFVAFWSHLAEFVAHNLLSTENPHDFQHMIKVGRTNEFMHSYMTATHSANIESGNIVCQTQHSYMFTVAERA